MRLRSVEALAAALLCAAALLLASEARASGSQRVLLDVKGPGAAALKQGLQRALPPGTVAVRGAALRTQPPAPSVRAAARRQRAGAVVVARSERDGGRFTVTVRVFDGDSGAPVEFLRWSARSVRALGRVPGEEAAQLQAALARAAGAATAAPRAEERRSTAPAAALRAEAPPASAPTEAMRASGSSSAADPRPPTVESLDAPRALDSDDAGRASGASSAEVTHAPASAADPRPAAAPRSPAPTRGASPAPTAVATRTASPRSAAGKTRAPATAAEAPAEAPQEPEGPGPVAARVTVGGRVVSRRLQYTDDVRNALPSYRLPVGPALAVGLDWYPGAHGSHGLWANVGVTASAEILVGVSSVMPDGSEHRTDSDTYRGGLTLRLPLGRGELGMQGTFGSHVFSFQHPARSAESLVPEVRYRSLRAGLFGRIPLLTRLTLVLEGGAHKVWEQGELGESFFPRHVVGAADGTLAAEYHLGEAWRLRFAAEYTRYYYAMHPEPGDRFIVGGALDEYLSGTVSLGFELR